MIVRTTCINNKIDKVLLNLDDMKHLFNKPDIQSNFFQTLNFLFYNGVFPCGSAAMRETWV